MTAITPQKPDLSGEWTLNRQTSMLSPIVAPTVQSGALRIEHREPRFKSHLTIVFADKPVESTFEVLSDGRDVTATDDRGQRIVSNLRWDEDALVATWRIQGPYGENDGVPLDRVISTFTKYLRGDESWKSDFQWRKMEL